MVQSRVAFGSSRERPTQLSRKAAARTTRRNSSSIPFFLPKRNDTDWVTLADGMAVADDTLWRWAGGVEGGLVNQRTGGHINYRGEGLVRGHGDKPPFRAAAAGRGTRLHRVPIRADAHRQDAPPCERPPATFALRFPPPFADWLAVRSRLTGLLLRMVDASHPPFSGYNCSAYSAQLREALLPWSSGGLSPTAIDMVFWNEMLPKVPAQNPEPVLSPARCEGPEDGFRGPLWRWYAPHVAAVLAARHPRLIKAVLRGACVGPRLEGGGQPVLELAWDRLAAQSLEEELARSAVDACDYPWVLLLDGTGPPRELLPSLRRGATVFKQASPYAEHWYARLRPWEHFVPVAENLADLPARVRWASDHPEEAAAIGARGRALAESLHELELACYWWQLLTAFAPLQSHLPRRLAARA
ncbi:hypothetical protein EMIHUDRAFT_196061 [Emiliania huxleyi CCMP1516]|uniref:Glycosyl transferase CAP10 domain-containing protein n=2 Tax=Emiliania huxleyi TaxID=2903 RepID=A0A0D3J3E6_EMIH1|nr:hypothetical protein EMIHUDRAFT_196061 [Emiliania huxleyi CCMP1516]EOD18031.1 hypothetical protein EMIHUDRAFT_196061 [Emiliania huxleyi CCMP1516]|eukprot:XP_005770460.1 hypothetical protein EMIHUDRAFT_196061 [Emiliania huxleyi CCMP1516]